jgi:hypothetical protein
MEDTMMAAQNKTRPSVTCAVLAAAMATTAGCFESNLTLRNGTGRTLTPYPVVSDPAPPHREADPAGNIENYGSASIDPFGFNPIYYVPGIDDEDQPNGVYLGLDLEGAAPWHIQYKIFHYKVPPGEAGKDPDKQPILLNQGVEDVNNEDQLIRVHLLTRPNGSEDWVVLITPG